MLRDSRAQKSQKLPTYLLPLQLSTVEHSSLGKRKTDLYIGTSPSTLLFLKVNFIFPGFFFVVHLFRGFYGGFQTLWSYSCNNHFIFLSLCLSKSPCRLIKEIPKINWHISMKINYFWKMYLFHDGCRPTVQMKLPKCQLKCGIKNPNIIGGNKRKLYLNIQIPYPVSYSNPKIYLQ